jgi:hypothetical protein
LISDTILISDTMQSFYGMQSFYSTQMLRVSTSQSQKQPDRRQVVGLDFVQGRAIDTVSTGKGVIRVSR